VHPPPFDTLIPEVFKVKNGKIIEIEATMPSLLSGPPPAGVSLAAQVVDSHYVVPTRAISRG